MFFLKSSGYSLALGSFSLAVPLLRIRSPACDQVPLFPSHFLCFPCSWSSFQRYPQKHKILLTLLCLEESPRFLQDISAGFLISSRESCQGVASNRAIAPNTNFATPINHRISCNLFVFRLKLVFRQGVLLIHLKIFTSTHDIIFRRNKPVTNEKKLSLTYMSFASWFPPALVSTGSFVILQS